MTPDTAADPLPLPENHMRSTAGMTTKVVKGSIWTLAGQIAPMAVAFVATPFTIRFLGSEGYGVLILIGLIPTYFSFADFGMSLAATKFGSEAYGRSDAEAEGRTVRTAAFIALCTTIPVALVIFALSPQIAAFFNVPETLLGEASIALKIASVSLVVNAMCSILNAPQLARLRMDISSLVNAIPKVLMMALTPIVLALGGGLLEAVLIGFIGSLTILCGHIFFSHRLLPNLFGLTIDRTLIRPLLKFGAGWLVASIAALLLVNAEKIILARFTTVRSLAYYSVAYTFAGMLLMFSMAMTQSLIPAFSQLTGVDKRGELQKLFDRTIRANMAWILPAVCFLTVVARPFLTIWAGEEFGRESAIPLYILLIGLFFNVFAFVPYTIIIAHGKTTELAILFLVELVFYIIVAIILIGIFGIIGAAISWTLRVTLDAFAMIWLAKWKTGIGFQFVSQFSRIALGIAILIPAVSISLIYPNNMPLVAVTTFVCLSAYMFFAWSILLDSDERDWLLTRLKSSMGVIS